MGAAGRNVREGRGVWRAEGGRFTSGVSPKTHTHTHIMNCLAHSPRKKRFSLSVLAAANHRPFPPSVSVLFHCFHVTPSTNGRPRTRRTLANQRPVAMSEAESIRESSPSFPSLPSVVVHIIAGLLAESKIVLPAKQHIPSGMNYYTYDGQDFHLIRTHTAENKRYLPFVLNALKVHVRGDKSQPSPRS